MGYAGRVQKDEVGGGGRATVQVGMALMECHVSLDLVLRCGRSDSAPTEHRPDLTMVTLVSSKGLGMILLGTGTLVKSTWCRSSVVSFPSLAGAPGH